MEPSSVRSSTEKASTERRDNPGAAQNSSGAVSGARNRTGSGVFRIRYGRLTMALLGLVMILAAAVTAALRLFGAGPAWVPAVCFVGGVGSVFLLRRLAVRDRRARLNAAFRAAMSTPAGPRDSGSSMLPESPARAPRQSEVFDADKAAAAPPPLSAFELRQAALAVAAAAGDTAAGQDSSDASKAGSPSLSGEWKPVDVPKPVYVEAAKAERPAPEPLDLPESPKPTGKPSLRQPAAPPAAAPAAAAAAKGSSALSNLDDVLQRRRA